MTPIFHPKQRKQRFATDWGLSRPVADEWEWHPEGIDPSEVGFFVIDRGRIPNGTMIQDLLIKAQHPTLDDFTVTDRRKATGARVFKFVYFQRALAINKNTPKNQHLELLNKPLKHWRFLVRRQGFFFGSMLNFGKSRFKIEWETIEVPEDSC